MSKAERGEIGALDGPAATSKGYAVWRVSSYVPPRTLTYEEAAERIEKRLVHVRAEDAARRASMEFLSALVEGKADPSVMERQAPLLITDPRARPFANQPTGEVPADPVAFEKDLRTVVSQDIRRRNEEAAALRTHLYRVAVVEDRQSPSRESIDEVASRGWRTRAERRLPTVRRAFFVEQWRDEALESVEARFYRDMTR
jgi:hypothetical protein